ncbi:MAG: hypothetical protein KH431_08920 [Erysipelotrichaceae bacterium]|nr:hypothetical protein [Erysipelotrichaceae bacterium]
MSKFEFKNQEKPELLKLQINGRNYSFNPLSLSVKRASEKFLKGQKVLMRQSKKENLKQEEISDIVYKCCDLVRETIDLILGNGAYEKIFGGRTMDFEENQELVTFIFQEIASFTKNKNLTVHAEEMNHEHLVG